jgi:hypothetical protein
MSRIRKTKIKKLITDQFNAKRLLPVIEIVVAIICMVKKEASIR